MRLRILNICVVVTSVHLPCEVECMHEVVGARSTGARDMRRVMAAREGCECSSCECDKGAARSGPA